MRPAYCTTPPTRSRQLQIRPKLSELGHQALLDMLLAGHTEKTLAVIFGETARYVRFRIAAAQDWQRKHGGAP